MEICAGDLHRRASARTSDISEANLQAFRGVLPDEETIERQSLPNRVVEGVAADLNRAKKYDAAGTQYGDFGCSPADVDEHYGFTGRNVDSRAHGSCDGLRNISGVARTRSAHRLLNRFAFDIGGAAGNGCDQ